MDNKTPLVTIGIVTYNSSKYVLETLDSIKKQTYKNIELIVSDDCSSDETVNICKKWIDENRFHFIRAELLTVENNTGTSGNCNRVLRESHGEWIKLIAGDDLLLPSALQDYIDFITSNNNINCCFAHRILFSGNLSDKNFTYYKISFQKFLFSGKTIAQKQFNVLTKMFIGSGPTFFFKKDTVQKVGGFDERFSLQEDYPLFIKLTKANFKFYLLDKYTVYKRVAEDSVCHLHQNNSIFSNLEIKNVKDWKEQYKYENSNVFWKKMLNLSLFIRNMIINSGNSRKNIKCACWYIVYKLLDPYVWYVRYMKVREKIVI